MTTRPLPWAAAVRGSPALASTAVLMLAMLVPSILAAAIDTRVLNGISVWVKPLKFQFSIAVHMLTVAWLAQLLPVSLREGHTFRRLVAVMVAAALFEAIYISWQGARGQASHFNTTSLLGGLMYALMGVGATVLVAVPAWIGMQLLRHGERGNPVVFAAGWGLLLGSVLGGLAGAYLSTRGGHWVGGLPSDAQGLPVVGWSRSGGDLRVPHFFGLHLMQVLPFTAWMLRERVNAAVNRGVTVVLGITGVLVTAATFVQAVAGQALAPG